MKKCISASSALLATAMMVTLSFGCGEGIEGETGSQSAALSKGQCNAIVATSLGTAQHCNNFGCSEGSPECEELDGAFLEFVGDESCVTAFVDGELNGLPGNALTGPNGEPKHLQEVICGAFDACNICDVLQGAGLCMATEACTG